MPGSYRTVILGKAVSLPMTSLFFRDTNVAVTSLQCSDNSICDHYDVTFNSTLLITWVLLSVFEAINFGQCMTCVQQKVTMHDMCETESYMHEMCETESYIP